MSPESVELTLRRKNQYYHLLKIQWKYHQVLKNYFKIIHAISMEIFLIAQTAASINDENSEKYLCSATVAFRCLRWSKEAKLSS